MVAGGAVRSRRMESQSEIRSASILIGLTLKDRYRVIEPISHGAMGAVFRAVDNETGEDVALKQSIDRRHEQRFEVESRLLSTLRHPRVVKIIDYFQDDSGQYLVMELVRGVELGDLLKQL